VLVLRVLYSFPADPAGQLNVLWQDRHALGVDGAEVRVLKESDEVRLGRLLQRPDGSTRKPNFRIKVLRDLAHKALEGQFAEKKAGGFLVLSNLLKRGRAGPVATPFGRKGGRESRVSRLFAAHSLSGCVFRAGHGVSGRRKVEKCEEKKEKKKERKNKKVLTAFVCSNFF